MDDALPVRIGDAVEDLRHQVHCPVHRDAPIAADHIPKRNAVHVLEDHIGAIRGFTGLVDRDDVGVLHLADGLRLPNDHLLLLAIQGGVEAYGLDGDIPVEVRILRQVDDPLGALSEFLHHPEAPDPFRTRSVQIHSRSSPSASFAPRATNRRSRGDAAPRPPPGDLRTLF